MVKNISIVYSKGLCCSCTVCSNYCHKDAITFQIDKLGFYKPVVDIEKCVNCGQCVKYCPGINDLKHYEPMSETTWYGYSLDEEVRINAASGGLTTELLCYMLEKKIVDYVTVVTNRTKDALPRQILTNNPKVIRECRTSKYCPISWNNILQEISNCGGTVALVGLACQINSVKHYYEGKKNCNVKYYISLICAHTPSLRATDYLASVSGKNYKEVSYRGGGWPGYMSFKSDKSVFKFPYRRTWPAGFGTYFKNNRCELCNDPFSRNADVVMGDSYPLQAKDTIGTTLAIVRNNKINQILESMNNNHIISLARGPVPEVCKHYNADLYDREDQFPVKNSMYANLGGG